MEILAEPSFIALDSGDSLRISITPLSDCLEQLLALDAVQQHIPFWQHPKWWQLANDTLFNGTLELISILDKEDNWLLALPVERVGKLLRSPKHPHLSISEALWLGTHTKESIDILLNAILNYANAWGWQTGNSPHHERVRLCEQLPTWQWRQARESAWFDTTTTMPIPGKLRRNLSRHERNLEASEGVTQYSITTGNHPDKLKEALQTFLSLEASGWKGKSGTAIKGNPELLSFYSGMTELNDPNLTLEIHELKLQGRSIANQLAFRSGHTRYLLKICYDEAFASFSPGSLLLRHTLQHCIDSDVEKLSLVTAPEWAMRWKPNVAPVWHATKYANTTEGKLRQQLSTIKRNVIQRLRNARERIPS